VANGDRGDRGLDEADNGGDVKVPRSTPAVVAAAADNDDTPRRNVEGTLPPPSSGEPSPGGDGVAVADATEPPPDVAAAGIPAASDSVGQMTAPD
jgi:hypothetical protein